MSMANVPPDSSMVRAKKPPTSPWPWYAPDSGLDPGTCQVISVSSISKTAGRSARAKAS